MSESNRPQSISRREFIGRAAGAAAGTGIGLTMLHQGVEALSAETKLERRNEQSGMIYKPFGKTGLNVSRLTFGCIQLSADRVPAMEMAVERGVNLVHISDGYVRGEAIVNLGKFLAKPGIRDKVWVMMKGVPDRGLADNIDNHLKTLNTDHIDIYCNPVAKPDLIRSEQELAKFEALKKAGKVRFLNLTSHTNIKESIETATAVPAYSSVLQALDLNSLGQVAAAIQNANKQNVGVMAMKSMRGGGRGKKGGGAPAPGPDQIAAALLPAGVTTILKTLNTPQDVDAWFAAVTKAPQGTAAAAPDNAVADNGICTLCGLCDGCPNGVAIQPVVLDYTYYYQQLGLPELAAERYAEIHPKQTALSCGDCGRCEEKCPMGVPVRQLIREAHARLSAIA